MLKYYIALFLLVAGVFIYIFIRDPCNQTFRADFSAKYPDYKILDTSAGEGSPENVQCRIYYEKPGSDQLYEDIWLYLNSDSGWKFSAIVASRVKERTP